MNDILFRTANTSDSVRIASLNTVSWRDSYRGILSDAYLDEEIAEERKRVWTARFLVPGVERRYALLAEMNKKLVGFVCVLLDEEPALGACIDNLHIRAEHKGQGLGRQLFAKATQWVMSKEPGWPIHLWVFEANHPARRFCEKFNGEVIERGIKEMPDGAKVPSFRYVWHDLGVLLNNLTTPRIE